MTLFRHVHPYFRYEFHLQSEEELQEEIELSTQEIEEIPEEIKVIHIDPQDYDGTGAHVQIC
jgi:hypothetical protein